MDIYVPGWARKHFWEEPPKGSIEFWAFRFKPKCNIGDTINFYFGNQLVATATVAIIELPGCSKCESTNRFKVVGCSKVSNCWKVFWKPESFKDLRSEKNDSNED